MHITSLKLRMVDHYANQVTPFAPDPSTLPIDANIDAERQELIDNDILMKSDSGSGFDLTPKGERYYNKVLLVKP